MFVFNEWKQRTPDDLMISSNGYEESVLRTREIPHRTIKFETGEENRIVYKILYRVEKTVFPTEA